MLTLTVDQWITRRKFYHVIHDEQGEPLFKAKFVGDCFDWLYAHDVAEFELLSDEQRWRVQLGYVAKAKE